MLVDGNAGAGGDSSEMLNSPNHTKTSEHTGRWGNPQKPGVVRARSKRSLLDDRRPRRRDDRSPPNTLGGDGPGVGANGDGDGRPVTVHDDVNPINRLSSGTLNARTNKALPRQMYDAMMTIASHRKVNAAYPVHQQQQRPAPGKHRKRQADLVVYRKDSSADDAANEAVNFVPLDSEHRIRVNLTIAPEDGLAGGPTYAVSLSLPGSASAAADQQRPQTAEKSWDVPQDTAAAAVAQPVSLLAGTECQCYCPCLDQDEDDVDDPQNAVRSTTGVSDSTARPTILPADDNDTSGAEFWTATSTPSFGTSEHSETSAEVSCPPPVLLFCEQGKHVHTHTQFII